MGKDRENLDFWSPVILDQRHVGAVVRCGVTKEASSPQSLRTRTTVIREAGIPARGV